jgi:hypothetical protein
MTSDMETESEDLTTELAEDFPDVRQKDQYACGAAASMAVGQHFGVGPKTLEEWKGALGTTLAKSTDPKSIEKYLRSLGLQVEAIGSLEVQDLRDATEQGMPVICPVQDYGKRRGQGAGFTYGHYLTVIGVALGYVLCQDSSEDNVLVPKAESIQEPGRVVIKDDVFEKSWHDVGVDGTKYIHYGIVVGPPRKVAPVEAANPRPRIGVARK